MTKLPEKKKRPTSVLVGTNTETMDYLGVQELFGIRRTLAYHLYETGAIKSFSLKEPGEKRGKRLFDVASIREFLNSKLENKRPAAAGKSERICAERLECSHECIHLIIIHPAYLCDACAKKSKAEVELYHFPRRIVGDGVDQTCIAHGCNHFIRDWFSNQTITDEELAKHLVPLNAVCRGKEWSGE